MCIFKFKRPKNMALEEVVKGEAQLPSIVKKIRIVASNESLFYKIYGDLTDQDCEIVVEGGNKVIISRDGKLSDVLEQGSYKLFDDNSFKKLISGKGGVAVTIYVFNSDYAYQCQWGMAGVPYRDPETEIPVNFKGYGVFECQVVNPEKFIKRLIGNLNQFTVDNFEDRVVAAFGSYVKSEVVKVIHDKHIGYIDLPLYEMEIAEAARQAISSMFEQQYGLIVPTLTFEEVTIDKTERAAVELELQARRDELKTKKDVKEIAAELERLQDKAWDREMLLRNLASADKAKYLDVLKEMGWPTPKDEKTLGTKFCPKCGAPVEPSAEFCSVCGEAMKTKKNLCPECKEEVSSKNEYCPHCGKKLK